MTLFPYFQITKINILNIFLYFLLNLNLKNIEFKNYKGMNSDLDIQIKPVIETIFEAKDSIIGPELVNTYYPNENHILLSSLDGNLILYNCNRKTRDFSSKVELTSKKLTPILSMTYNSSEKAIVFLDAFNYIHYDNLEDTSNHRYIKENIEEIESIIYLTNNKYFIKTNSCINYIYEINKESDSTSPFLVTKPIIKYIFSTKPTAFFKTDTHFYVGCQRAVYSINLKSFHTQTPKIIYALNILNNKNINDINEGVITSMFYYDPNSICYKDYASDTNKNIKYILNPDNKNNSSAKIENIEDSDEEESESNEDNTDELLIIGNNLGKVEVIPMENIDKKYSFKCFVKNDYFVSVTSITYDNLRQNIYIGSHDGCIYGLNIVNKKKIFFNNKFRGGIYGMVYIPKLDRLVYSVTNFEDEIYCEENFREIKKNQNKRISDEIFEDKNNEIENKENKMYMVNDIDGFIKLINKK